MFNRLISALSGPAPASPGAAGQLALAALLVRLARADGDYADAERRQIDLILTERFGLSGFEAVALRGKAEALERESADTVRFTRALKELVPHEGRAEILAELWRVALVDEARSADEEAVIRLVASLLGISDKDSALARQRVQNR